MDHIEVLRILLDKEAVVNVKDSDGITPLHFAAGDCHISVVKILLERGADVNAEGNDGITPLMLAAIKGHAAVVKILLERGADVNAKDTDGWTPLMWADEEGHDEVVKILLEKGADKEQLGQVRQSAMQRLMQHIVSWDPETATQAEIEEMIRYLDKITKEVGKAKTEYDKENAEALAIQKNYDRFVAAAEILDKQLQEAAVAGNSAKERELGASLEKLLKELEIMQPEVEREAKEVEDARVFYEELHAMATQTADKVLCALKFVASHHPQESHPVRES